MQLTDDTIIWIYIYILQIDRFNLFLKALLNVNLDFESLNTHLIQLIIGKLYLQIQNYVFMTI